MALGVPGVKGDPKGKCIQKKIKTSQRLSQEGQFT